MVQENKYPNINEKFLIKSHVVTPEVKKFCGQILVLLITRNYVSVSVLSQQENVEDGDSR